MQHKLISKKYSQMNIHEKINYKASRKNFNGICDMFLNMGFTFANYLYKNYRNKLSILPSANNKDLNIHDKINKKVMKQKTNEVVKETLDLLMSKASLFYVKEKGKLKTVYNNI